MAICDHRVPCKERDDDGDTEVVAETVILSLAQSNGSAAAVLHLLRDVSEVERAGLRAIGPLRLPLVLGHG